MLDNKNTRGYYIVKWYRPPHKLQEDTDIFHEGDVVFNATYLNTVQKSHHWYTQTTVKTAVRVQKVLAANIDL